jgi:hypothetical protein
VHAQQNARIPAMAVDFRFSIMNLYNLSRASTPCIMK